MITEAKANGGRSLRQVLTGSPDGSGAQETTASVRGQDLGRSGLVGSKGRRSVF